MALRGPVHGFRFKPTDKELMQYLEGFVLGNPLKNTSDFIAVEDLYGEKEPSEIFGTGSDDSIRYYFTQLRRKCERGSRFLRGVGDGGTWKGQEAGQPVKDDKTKRVIGFKKSLRFECKKSRRKVGGAGEVWLMKEYSLSDDYLRDKNVVSKDVVLCRIKRVFRKTSRNCESTQNIHENDSPLDVYEWPENDVTVSLPPSATSSLPGEVSTGVDDAYGGISAMGDDDGILIDDLDKLLATTPPHDIFNDYIGEIGAMNNDTLLDGLDELLKTIPSDIFNDNIFCPHTPAQQNSGGIHHPFSVPNLNPI